MSSKGSVSLCLECGLCCNGVIFADVKLQLGDGVARLRSLGLPISTSKSEPRAPGFNQPCAALEGCRCRIYAERPKYCRTFDCLILKSVKAGRLETAAALPIIRTARERADKVRRLLLALGDTDEQVALAARFQRTARRLEEGEFDEQTADAYGELTLAVHDLNVILNDAFYPGG